MAPVKFLYNPKSRLAHLYEGGSDDVELRGILRGGCGRPVQDGVLLNRQELQMAELVSGPAVSLDRMCNICVPPTDRPSSEACGFLCRADDGGCVRRCCLAGERGSCSSSHICRAHQKLLVDGKK